MKLVKFKIRGITHDFETGNHVLHVDAQDIVFLLDGQRLQNTESVRIEFDEHGKVQSVFNPIQFCYYDVLRRKLQFGALTTQSVADHYEIQQNIADYVLDYKLNGIYERIDFTIKSIKEVETDMILEEIAEQQKAWAIDAALAAGDKAQFMALTGGQP